MKNLRFILVIILLLIPLSGCDFQDAKYINFSTKPNDHYYTDKLRSKILSNEQYTIYVFDTNLYKEIEVPSEENSILENFTSALINDNYINEKVDAKEPFRLKIVFKDDKYLLKVFNDSIVSISSWDGNYKEDIISIKNLPLRYNLYDFCKHIQNKPSST